MGVGDLCYRTSAITLRIVRKTSTTIPGHSISYVFRTIPPTRPFTILSMKPKFSLGNSTGTACSAAQQQNQHKGVSRILVSTANIQKGEKEKSITSNLQWDLIFSDGKLKELRLPVRPPSWIFKPLKIGGNRLFPDTHPLDCIRFSPSFPFPYPRSLSRQHSAVAGPQMRLLHRLPFTKVVHFLHGLVAQ